MRLHGACGGTRTRDIKIALKICCACR